MKKLMLVLSLVFLNACSSESGGGTIETHLPNQEESKREITLDDKDLINLGLVNLKIADPLKRQDLVFNAVITDKKPVLKPCRDHRCGTVYGKNILDRNALAEPLIINDVVMALSLNHLPAKSIEYIYTVQLPYRVLRIASEEMGLDILRDGEVYLLWEMTYQDGTLFDSGSIDLRQKIINFLDDSPIYVVKADGSKIKTTQRDADRKYSLEFMKSQIESKNYKGHQNLKNNELGQRLLMAYANRYSSRGMMTAPNGEFEYSGQFFEVIKKK